MSRPVESRTTQRLNVDAEYLKPRDHVVTRSGTVVSVINTEEFYTTAIFKEGHKMRVPKAAIVTVYRKRGA